MDLSKLSPKHRSIREKVRAELIEVYRDAVDDSDHFEKTKPDVLKRIDASLDKHIFRPLFT